MLTFIVNNMVWFIVCGILIVLIIIGYFIDKKGLNQIQKFENSKDSNIDKDANNIEDTKSELNEEKSEELNIENNEEIKTDFINREEEDLTVPFGDPVSKDIKVDGNDDYLIDDSNKSSNSDDIWNI